MHCLGTCIVPRCDVLSRIIPIKTLLVICPSPRCRACLRCMPILDVKTTRKTYVPVRIFFDDVRIHLRCICGMACRAKGTTPPPRLLRPILRHRHLYRRCRREIAPRNSSGPSRSTSRIRRRSASWSGGVHHPLLEVMGGSSPPPRVTSAASETTNATRSRSMEDPPS